MIKVMHKLGYKIPKFYLTRYCKFVLSGKGDALHIKGIDEMGAPFSCFTQVTLMSGKTRVIVKREPFAMPIPSGISEFDIIMYTYGHYKEPGCKIHVNLKGFKTVCYTIQFDPQNPEKGWTVNPFEIMTKKKIEPEKKIEEVKK